MLRKKLLPAWQKGFTLIELLVVIGIIGILITVVLVAINPGRQFAMARDTQRRSDLYSITNALYQYAAENDGNFPDVVEGMGSWGRCLGTGSSPNGDNCIDLSVSPPAGLVDTYIPEMPIDPDSSVHDSAYTGYWVGVDANERIVATAASEVNAGQTITITR